MPPAPSPGKKLVAGGPGSGSAFALTLPYSPRMVPAMADKEHSGPGLSARGRQAQAARQARQAQALRENLRKRAAQRRGRPESGGQAPDTVSLGAPDLDPGRKGDA